jgi:hypothetical protein
MKKYLIIGYYKTKQQKPAFIKIQNNSLGICRQICKKNTVPKGTNNVTCLNYATGHVF